MPATVLSVPAFSLRRIETPFERSPGYKNFVAIVESRDLPDLTKWRDINVRDAKERGRVPEKIRASFRTRPDEFVFMNRGLVIAAEKVELVDATKELKITLRDPAVHGLLDGGHTWRIVRKEAAMLSSDDAPRYVRVEFITGFDRDEISAVVEARNTSNQVRDESISNLRGEYDDLKKVLEPHLYYEEIAWSEFEELTSGVPKPIEIRDIVSFIVAFDTGEFTSTLQPLIAYKDKRACLKHFRDHRPRLKKYIALLPEILLLWDDIHERWREWYHVGRQQEDSQGKFGKLTAVKILPESNPNAYEDLYFRRRRAKWTMPEAYKYPILSALRAAVEVRGKEARWQADPFELLKTTGPQMTAIVGQAIRTTNSPNKVGKDPGVWSSCYLVVESALKGTVTQLQSLKIEKLERELEQLRKVATTKR